MHQITGLKTHIQSISPPKFLSFLGIGLTVQRQIIEQNLQIELNLRLCNLSQIKMVGRDRV